MKLNHYKVYFGHDYVEVMAATVTQALILACAERIKQAKDWFTATKVFCYEENKTYYHIELPEVFE